MTIEEIQAALIDDTLLQEVIAYVGTTDKGKENLTNYLESNKQAIINQTTSDIYNRIDEDIFNELGVRKEQNIKTWDFLKGKLGSIKELNTQIENLSKGDDKQTILGLKSKIKELENNPNNSNHWHDVHQSAISKWDNEKLVLDNEIVSLNEKIENIELEHNKSIKSNNLSMSMASLVFDDTIDENVRKTFIESTRGAIIDNSEIKDGKLIHKDSDGTILLNEKHLPISTEELLASRFSGILKQSGGSATRNGKQGKVERQGDNAVLTLDKSAFTTKVGFSEECNKVLKSQGILPHSEEGIKLVNGAYLEHNVKELPRE